MNLIGEYFSFCFEEKKKSNFEKYFLNKYQKDSITYTTDNEIKIPDIERNLYDKLKYFFLYYNKDSEVISFNNKIYRNYKFDFLKIITKEDLEFISNTSSSDFKTEYKLNYKVENLSPIEWKYFFNYICKECKNKNENKLDPNKIDEILDNLTKKIKSRKFNFRLYEQKYSQAKLSLLLNLLKFTFLTEIKHPGPAVIKENSELL